MGKDYSIFRKILLIFTTIDNPFLVLLDKMGLAYNLTYRTYKGTKFIARAKSTDINEGIAIFSGKEYPDNILNISSKSNPLIIDAGAHIGLFSLYIKSLNSSSKIYAIEPLVTNVSNMKKNLDLNKILGVTVLNLALSGKKGWVRLWLSNKEFDNATISLAGKKKGNEEYMMVKTDTLTGVVKNNHISNIDILKMDIEGVEYEVIKKDIKLISEKVESFLVEYHTDNDINVREKIISMLTENNFRFIFEGRHILGFLNNRFN